MLVVSATGNQTLRQMSIVKDIVVVTSESKVRWVGHSARLADNRWTSCVTKLCRGKENSIDLQGVNVENGGL